MPDLSGVPDHWGLDERSGEPVRDHALLGRRRELLVAQPPADRLADHGPHLLVGERLRAGQLQPSAPVEGAGQIRSRVVDP
jgi:hypothetical protein